MELNATPEPKRAIFMQQSISSQQGRQARILKLKIWMLEHDVTFKLIGQILGISGRAASNCLYKDRMPVRHHRALRYRLDVPVDLLPRAEDVPTGPKPRD